MKIVLSSSVNTYHKPKKYSCRDCVYSKVNKDNKLVCKLFYFCDFNTDNKKDNTYIDVLTCRNDEQLCGNYGKYYVNKYYVDDITFNF